MNIHPAFFELGVRLNRRTLPLKVKPEQCFLEAAKVVCGLTKYSFFEEILISPFQFLDDFENQGSFVRTFPSAIKKQSEFLAKCYPLTPSFCSHHLSFFIICCYSSFVISIICHSKCCELAY